MPHETNNVYLVHLSGVVLSVRVRGPGNSRARVVECTDLACNRLIFLGGKKKKKTDLRETVRILFRSAIGAIFFVSDSALSCYTVVLQ